MTDITERLRNLIDSGDDPVRMSRDLGNDLYREILKLRELVTAVRADRHETRDQWIECLKTLSHVQRIAQDAMDRGTLTPDAVAAFRDIRNRAFLRLSGAS